MTTDFFQRQSDAQKSTTWLVVMFGLAVIAIVGSVFGIALVAVASQLKEPVQNVQQVPSVLVIPTIAAAVALLLIAGGTLFKVFELRGGGGTHVAESLGGKRIFPNTSDPAERRLLNVVEEMALASGTPVPPVFFLAEEGGINAFAAGYSPSDAVLGVTRGCAEKLTRDQLQGVMAHEFSHILNGDMRMSIRLIGILHGILLLGLTGQLVFRLIAYSGTGRSRRGGKDGGGQIIIVILLLGVALIVLGFVGTFFGNLIKAAVSRQREYLADASAVQFTRNPAGLSGALQRIGATAKGSRLRAAGAAEASHMYFAKGVFEGFSGLWATHPPLTKRIRAIDPSWDGKFPVVDATAARISSELAAGFVGDAHSAEEQSARPGQVPLSVVDHAVEHVGEPTEAHRHYAADLLANLPKSVLDAAREGYGARAIMFGLLLDRQEEVRRSQLQVLQSTAQKDVVRLTHTLLPMMDQLDVRARLPLVDLALPALRSMSKSQYQTFSYCFVALVNADKKIDLFEWMLSQVLLRHLRPQFEPVRSPRIQYYGLQRLSEPCSILLSAIAYAGNSDEVANASFASARGHLPEVDVQLRTRATSGLGELRDALTILTKVTAKHRGRIVDACAAAICADEHVTWQEAELLRGISDLLDCPMPPLLAAA